MGSEGRAGSVVTMVLAMVVLAAACTGGGTPGPGPSVATFRPAGGELRVGVLTELCDLTFCGGPHADAQWAGGDVVAYEIARCCLVRTLLSYNGQPTSGGGTVLRPDVARALPTISPDGLTWTFHLKPGLRYAPPLQRTTITARDFVRSFERLLGPPPADGPDYYAGILGPYTGGFLGLRDLIAGAADYIDGRATSISGLEAPDPLTLRIHLTRPDGALGSILSEPDLAPIPANPFDPGARFGVLDGHDRFSWGYVVSTGPYMIEGADKVDLSTPPGQRLPAVGDAPDSLTLVRNPSWDRATDLLRPAHPDRIVLTPVATEEDGMALIRTGALDLMLNQAPGPDLLKPGSAGPGSRAVTDLQDFIAYANLNLALPPFDDLHVRLAVDAAVDREAIARAFIEAGQGSVPTTHIGLDSEEDNLLLNFDAAGRRSSEALARQEMAQSRYDTDHDGTCDADACKGITMIVRTYRPGQIPAARVLAENLRPLGLDIRLVPLDQEGYNAYYGHPEKHTAIRFDLWIKDLTNGATYFPPLFGSPALGGDPSFPETLLGATPRELERWGYPITSVPNVDDRIRPCLLLSFRAATECWARLDQYLMTEVAADIPLVVMTSGRVLPPRVVRMSFDQSDPMPMPSLDRVVLRGPPPTASPEPSVQVSTIPEGIYRFTITKDDLLRFDPTTDPGGVDENTGTFTVTLRDGWFSMLERADHPIFNPLSVGTYAGTGDQVVFDTLEPTFNAIHTPPMRWTFDGHALRLRFLGCADLDELDPGAPNLCQDIKTVYEAHPWVKIG